MRGRGQLRRELIRKRPRARGRQIRTGNLTRHAPRVTFRIHAPTRMIRLMSHTNRPSGPALMRNRSRRYAELRLAVRIAAEA